MRSVIRRYLNERLNSYHSATHVQLKRPIYAEYERNVRNNIAHYFFILIVVYCIYDWISIL